MFCAGEEKEEGQKRRERSMPALFMEINRQYGKKCFGRLHDMGIQPGQMPIIMIVYGNDGCSQKEIAQKMGVKPPTVNISIQRLEKADIVCRKRDEKDQRVMRVYLTENGKKTVEGIIKQNHAMEKVMFNNFNDTELCLMRRFFEQILENIEQIQTDTDFESQAKAVCTGMRNLFEK